MSEIAQLLEETALRLLAGRWDDAAAARSGAPWPDPLWQEFVELGFTRALVSEERGGAELLPGEGLDMVRALAGHDVPLSLPLPEAMLAGHLIDRAGLDLPEGLIAFAVSRPSEPMRLGGGEGRAALSGRVARVPWGRHADWLLVAAGDEGGECLVLVSCEDAEIQVGANLAGEPRDTMVFADAAIATQAPFAGAGRRLLEAGAAIRTVQIAGASRALLATVLDYANSRVQFGRPIGKFQAVQQNLAVMAAQTAAATGAADLAVEASAGWDPFGIAVGKARAGEAAGAIAGIAHQCMGAIGFTKEHRLHRFTKRLLSWRDEFGSEAFWSCELGRRAFSQPGSQLWRLVIAS